MRKTEEFASINLPKNLEEKDREVYQFYSSYKIKRLKVVELRNVFVTRSGIVLKNLLLVPESVSAYKKQKLEYHISALYNFFFRKREILKNEAYLLIHNPWCPGHFAWIGQALARLLQVKEICSSLILVLPESFQRLLPSLEPFKFKSVFLIPERKGLEIQKLVMPSNPLFGGEFVPHEAIYLRKLYLEYFKTYKYMDLGYGANIYVSRGKAKYRKIQNEAEVVELLRKYNFSILHFEDFGFWEQVSIMYHCKIIVSMHGAGFANIQFMNVGGTMLEFINENANNIKDFRPSFFRLSSILGLSYFYQWCETENVDKPYDSDLAVDLVKLEKNLKLMKN